jgi:SAM-dependent methyltransferase
MIQVNAARPASGHAPLSRADLAAGFAWPAPPGSHGAPSWTGHGFTVDGQATGVLSYLPAQSGWSDELTAMHESEAGADHPIDLASRGRAIAEVRPFVEGRPSTVLEVGCSSGYLLHDLRTAFPEALVVGADYVGAPLHALARSHPDIPLLQIDLVRCPLPDASVDAVIALNVLEHIEDDRGAIAQIHRVLRPGGVAYIELPAGPLLYDVHDKVLMHHRRYTLRGAARLFERAGFRVKNPSHLGFVVYPGFVAAKLRNKLHLLKNEAAQREVVAAMIRNTRSSRLMAAAMGLEKGLARFVRFPVGVRLTLTAVKS